MSRTRFKWFQNLESITPVFNAVLTVGDTFQTILNKIQGLLRVHSRRSVITSAVSVGASSTADQVINSLTIPAGELNPGDVFSIDARGIWSKPLSLTTTIEFWVKVGGTKEGSIIYTSIATVTAQAFSYSAHCTIRSIGVSGSCVACADLSLMTSATASVNLSSTGTTPGTIDTTSAITIQVGVTFSNSNAANDVTAVISTIIQE